MSAVPYTSTQQASTVVNQQALFTKIASGQKVSQDELNALQQSMALDAAHARNREFLRRCQYKEAACVAQGGSFAPTYAAGTTFTFEVPPIAGGIAQDVIIELDMSLTFAAGSSAVYALTAAGVLALIQQMQIQFNGTQMRTYPVIKYFWDTANGYDRAVINGVNAGYNDSGISNNIKSAFAVTGTATWKLRIRIPLNALSADNPAGCLPVSGVGQQPQILLTTPAALLGTDALQNVVYAVSGSGHAVTIGGTSAIKCYVGYKDGTNLFDNNILPMDLSIEPTCQYFIDTPKTLTAGTVVRQQIVNLQEHWYVFSIVIDAQSPATFCADGNLTFLQLSPDLTGFDSLMQYNSNINVDVYEFYRKIREQFGQDFGATAADQGIIPWVLAAQNGINNPGNRAGMQPLNMRAGGHQAVSHGYQVTTVGSNGSGPRVETLLISKNPDGLFKRSA